MNANGEAERFIQPRWAAQATTAGAVNERKPATTPIQNARSSVTSELRELFDQSGLVDSNADVRDNKGRCRAKNLMAVVALLTVCRLTDPSVTDYLEHPAKCPTWRREILEKTLVEPA